VAKHGEASQTKHLVLVGAGEGHLACVKHIGWIRQQGWRITLLDPESWIFERSLGPAALWGEVSLEQFRRSLASVLPPAQLTWRRSRVIGWGSRRQELVLANQERLAYDIVSFAVGCDSRTTAAAWPSRGWVRPSPLVELLTLRNTLDTLTEHTGMELRRLVVLAGHPGGLQMALACHEWLRDQGRRRLWEIVWLHPRPAEYAAWPSALRRSMEKIAGINSIRLIRLEPHNIQPQRIVFEHGAVLECACGIHLEGLHAPPWLKHAEHLCDAQGRILVDRAGRVDQTKNALASGTCCRVAASAQPALPGTDWVISPKQHWITLRSLLRGSRVGVISDFFSGRWHPLGREQGLFIWRGKCAILTRRQWAYPLLERLAWKKGFWIEA
jgi:NADH dehydrogenase FAD-containing subunit